MSVMRSSLKENVPHKVRNEMSCEVTRCVMTIKLMTALPVEHKNIGLTQGKPEFGSSVTLVVCLNGIEPSHMASEATALSAELQAHLH